MYSFANNLKRFASFLVDILILNTIITKPLSSLVEISAPESLTDLLNLDLRSLFLIMFLVSTINFLYWVILEYKIKQTIGSLIFNIYVKSETKTLTLSQIFIRNLTKLSLILLMIDSIGILFSKKRQRFTEKLSKTLTVQNG